MATLRDLVKELDIPWHTKCIPRLTWIGTKMKKKWVKLWHSHVEKCHDLRSFRNLLVEFCGDNWRLTEDGCLTMENDLCDLVKLDIKEWLRDNKDRAFALEAEVATKYWNCKTEKFTTKNSKLLETLGITKPVKFL